MSAVDEVPAPEVSPEPPSRAWRGLLALLGRLPQAGLSRGLGRLADVPIPPPLRKPILGKLASALGMDLDEAARPLEAFTSANDLFVRRLREGVRRWPDDPRALASPVDGIVGAVGEVRRGRAIQAKGRDYAVADLLADPGGAERYDGGLFVTLYLSPRHYHRIHAPTGGTIAAARHVPGALLPVNGPAVAHVPDLFPRNERLLCGVDGPLGRVAVVAVGAYNVGRISAAFDPAWSGRDGMAWITNRRKGPPEERAYDPPVRVERGAEIMAFHLGSTVVLLVEPGRVAPTDACAPGREVRLGDALAVPVDGDHLSRPSTRTRGENGP